VGTISEIERPGDYCGPDTITSGSETYQRVMFLKPNARDPDAPPIARSIQWVKIPPHSVRECADGSLEIRDSIGATRSRMAGEEGQSDGWHGFLDEGHRWRYVGPN
jgi:hypothetical protein